MAATTVMMSRCQKLCVFKPELEEEKKARKTKKGEKKCIGDHFEGRTKFGVLK